MSRSQSVVLTKDTRDDIVKMVDICENNCRVCVAIIFVK